MRSNDYGEEARPDDDEVDPRSLHGDGGDLFAADGASPVHSASFANGDGGSDSFSGGDGPADWLVF